MKCIDCQWHGDTSLMDHYPINRSGYFDCSFRKSSTVLIMALKSGKINAMENENEHGCHTNTVYMYITVIGIVKVK